MWPRLPARHPPPPPRVAYLWLVSMSALASLAAVQPALAFDSRALSAADYPHGSTIGELHRGGASLRSQQQLRRRVNWWFNIFDESTSAHVLQVARAHRSALTGVVQWVQPGGFGVHGDAN